MVIHNEETKNGPLSTACGVKVPDLSKMLTWIIGLSILAGMTVKECLPLFWQYRYNNVATQIRVIPRNESITPPYMAMCAGRGASSLPELAQQLFNGDVSQCSLCQSLRNHSWDLWDENITYPSRIAVEHALSNSFMNKLTSTPFQDWVDILRVKNIVWIKPIVEVILNLFACLTTMDAEAEFGIDNRYIRDCIDRYNDFVQFDKETVDKLADIVFELIASNVMVTWPIGGSKMAPLNRVPGSSLIMYPDFFCASLPMSENGYNLSISTSDDGLLVSTAWMQLMAHSDETWPHRRTRRTLYSSDRSMIRMGMIKVFITYAIETIVLEKRGIQCFDESTPGTCVDKCVMNKIINYCDCVPFTGRYWVESGRSIPYCNPSIYFNCTALNKSQEIRQCEEECRIPCEYRSYRWNVASYLYEPSGPRRLRVYAKPIITPIIEFSVVLSDTPEQFLSRIGAVVNFHLGVSGLTLVAVTLYIIRFAKQHYSQWKERKRERVLRTLEENAHTVRIDINIARGPAGSLKHEVVNELKTRFEKDTRRENE